MSAAGIAKQIQQARAAVAEAEATHEGAGGSNKELHSQLLLARSGTGAESKKVDTAVCGTR